MSLGCLIIQCKDGVICLDSLIELTALVLSHGQVVIDVVINLPYYTVRVLECGLEGCDGGIIRALPHVGYTHAPVGKTQILPCVHGIGKTAQGSSIILSLDGIHSHIYVCLAGTYCAASAKHQCKRHYKHSQKCRPGRSQRSHHYLTEPLNIHQNHLEYTRL